MHCERTRTLLGCALFLILTLPAALTFASTCNDAVQYKDGLLSIQSNGCSVQQLLSAVQTQTGIEIEIPPSAAQVRLSLTVDPGQPAAVLTSLLSSTQFNYYMVGGEQNSVARVVISEISAPATVATQVTPPSVGASAPHDAAAADTTATKKKPVIKKKEDKDDKLASNDIVVPEDEQKPKPELDESTLRNLPQLPPGLPVALWRLYPDIVQNGGVVSDAPLTMANGTPVPRTSGQDGASYYPQDPPPLPKGVVGLPTLPPDIDPNMGKLYPWNLMQTIHGPITYPNINLPPMAPPIGGTPAPRP